MKTDDDIEVLFEKLNNSDNGAGDNEEEEDEVVFSLEPKIKLLLTNVLKTLVKLDHRMSV